MNLSRLVAFWSGTLLNIDSVYLIYACLFSLSISSCRNLGRLCFTRNLPTSCFKIVTTELFIAFFYCPFNAYGICSEDSSFMSDISNFVFSLVSSVLLEAYQVLILKIKTAFSFAHFNWLPVFNLFGLCSNFYYFSSSDNINLLLFF